MLMILHRVRAVLIALCVVTLAACGGGSGGSGGGGGSHGTPIYPTTSLNVAVGNGLAPAGMSFNPMTFLGTFGEVTSVTVVVSGLDQYGVFQNPLASVSLTKDVDGVWKGTIPNLPVGPVLTFTAHGYKAGPIEIFNGVLSQALTGSGDSLTIAMSPVDDGTVITFPIITSISLPAEIVHDTPATVNVNVKGSPSETLNYTITSGGGGFVPASGSIGLPTGGTGTVASTYTAPTLVDTYNHTVRVTNSLGFSVEQDFSTVVVDSLTTAGVQTLFGPTILSLSGKRTGNAVTWTATVDDDKSTALLSYVWNFSQTGGTAGSSFTSPSTNPGVMSAYEEHVTGTVTLAVTDGDGLTTTISFTLVDGQFPDNAVVTPGLSLNFATASGTPISAEGTWVGCQPENHLREEHTYAGM
ncbi:MAG TPA: hypothetical protein VF678_07090, partial [bacterium]